ncbi:MAG: hypothetical protein NTW21_32655 [Verrucomicrobia bacterium]|nr:hypothetical protein [Verrucomicrobiota bacterium]
MTNNSPKLDQLEIIGYADVLTNGKGPAVVPPVFRDRNEPTRCFVPPFRLCGDWLLDPQAVSFQEVQELAQDRQITLFPDDTSHPARPDWRLWVDLDGNVHYEPSTQGRENLQRLSHKHLAAATAALSEGNLDEADREAGIALAADERALEPHALITACHALRGEVRHVAFMRRQVEVLGHNLETFGLLVRKYAEMMPMESLDTDTLESAHAVSETMGVEIRRMFVLPLEVFPYVAPVLQEAESRQTDTSIEIRCCGPDAEFLLEFVRLFRHNSVPTLSGGQAAEVVRKDFWGRRPRRSRLVPQDNIENYFHRLEAVLVETGVLGFVLQRSSNPRQD